MASEIAAIHEAGPDDAADVARLLHDFNTEFDEPSPGVEVLTGRARELLAAAEMRVLLVGEPRCGLALIRFRRSVWTGALDAYLEELYVAPERRGQGMGRALLEATIELAREAGAEHLELVTSEDDTAALGLYESSGFINREGHFRGPVMLYYERDI